MILPPPDWMRSAVCTQTGYPDDWFPEAGGGGSYARVRFICNNCPVQVECLTYAIANNENDGMWGGKTPDERQEIRTGRPRRNGRGAAA